MELGSLDVLKILGYGLSGFAFLLVFLAFMLLRKEQDKPEPRKMIIQTIQMFMGLCLLLSISVGIISVPISSQNSQLQAVITTGNQISSTGNRAEGAADKLVNLATHDKLDSNAIRLSEITISNSLDSIRDVIAASRPEDSSSMASIASTQALVQKDFVRLHEVKIPMDSVRVITSRILINTRKAKSVALPKMAP